MGEIMQGPQRGAVIKSLEQHGRHVGAVGSGGILVYAHHALGGTKIADACGGAAPGGPVGQLHRGPHLMVAGGAVQQVYM